MKAALLIVLSLSALAMAGPAFNKNTNNHIADMNQQMTKENYMTIEKQQQHQIGGDFKKTEAVEILQKWCFASQMSQSELTQSFKRLVSIVKSSPQEESTEAAVMSGRICQGALVQKSEKTGQTAGQTETDAQAHELIKDVYMDSLMACERAECMQQLLDVIESEQVDPIRASYYMTRIAVGGDISQKSTGIKDEQEVKQLAQTFIQKSGKPMYSEAVERQQLLAVTATLGKSLEQEESKQQKGELVEIAQQVAKVIVERYIKPVSQQEVREYSQTGGLKQNQNMQLVKKMAKRSAGLKALSNMPNWCLKDVEQSIVEIVQNKDESSTVRQSAIECLEENEKFVQLLKEITFDQEEPTEVRVAAYRALMTCVEEDKEQKDLISQLIKHCEQTGNQQQDEQFCLYVISHLDNLRSSEQPELASIKETIEENKQHQMQIQQLALKFKQQLEQVGKSSRNFKLEQQFNQLETGITLQGDIVYESEDKKQSPIEVLPKVVRLNVSMPVMGDQVNVFEVILRQSNMDEQLAQVLSLVQSAKINGPDAMNKVVDSFKQAAEKQIKNTQHKQTGSQQEQPEGDLCIKIDGQTVVFMTLEDVKCVLEHEHKQRVTRSTGAAYETGSIFESILEHLKRQPVAFNRGINFNLNERVAKLLDVEASLIAGLRFESRAQGRNQDDFELLVRAEPRLAFESIVGPAKLSAKKLLNRLSTKSSLGLRLRYKEGELVDLEIELPMEKYELFTFEQQIVQKNRQDSFSYLEESVFGQADIYGQDDIFEDDDDDYTNTNQYNKQQVQGMRKMKRSVFGGERHSTLKQVAKLVSGKQTIFGVTYETPEELARVTGMSGKLRLVVSPKELGFIVQCVAQKVDPAMRSIRVQLQKEESRVSGSQKQYQLTLSTPGSRVQRTTQIRLVQQLGSQRHLVKAAIESPMMTGQAVVEFVHDGRQYAVKCELQAEREKHTFEVGVQRGQQSASGRIAATYKPYLQIDSTKLKRPVQMQAVVSVQQEPKTVIAYELKSMSQSANYVQGKIIIDAKSSQFQAGNKRRSLESPIERMLTQDWTLVSELVLQVEQQLAKVHKMVQWEPSKWACQADMSVQHKNLRKNQEKQMSGLIKIDSEKQMVQWERKSQQQPRDNFRFQVVSELKAQQHQLVAELRYKENLGEIVAYKHKVGVVSGKPTSWNKFDLVTEVELIASQYNVAEKLSGRTHAIWERQQKLVECELSSNNKQAKISMDWASLEQHKIELMVKVDRVGQHVTQIRSLPQTWSLVSRTDCLKRQQLVQKTEIEILKPTGYGKRVQGQLVLPEVRCRLEMPTKQVVVAFDAKLNSGKPSSWQVECPVFVSRGEFTFATLARANHFLPAMLRFKSENRNLINKDAYWMDTHFEPSKRSFVRAHSPIYAAELEIEPNFEETKMGFFARNKRSVDQFDEIYSPKSSLFGRNQQQNEKLELANKLWAARGIFKRLPAEQKKRIMNLVLEYVDRDQSHNHQLTLNPLDYPSARFNLNAQSQQNRWSPMRLSGRFESDPRRASQLEMESQWGEFQLTGKPYDGETAFTKLSAISRHPRSVVRRHESEARYEREHGFRAQAKHQDADQKNHQIWIEAAKNPVNFAKLQLQSDKHGKAKWEHKWRHEQRHNKRSIVDDSQEEAVFQNQLVAEYESPISQLSQRTQFNWEEPINFAANKVGRRQQQTGTGSDKYSLVDYLKRVNGRFQSQWHKQQQPLYELDFDFKPESQDNKLANLKMRLNKEWVHDSQLAYQPAERLYKLSSRTLTDRTREPIYEFTAQTKSPRVFGLATEQQEPLFFNDQHQMVSESRAQSPLASLFKQPLKLDYTDKFGRVAGFDYDHSPIVAAVSGMDKPYAGLRQKRAAVYYRDPSQEIEHNSEIDFYPELVFAGNEKHQQQQLTQGLYGKNHKNIRNMLHLNEKPGQMTLKTQTKYGPVVAQIDSDLSACQIKLVSPVVTGKLTAETAGKQSGAKLFKLELTNKQQQVSLEKIIRQLPILNKVQLLKEAAKKLDQSRFEHESELLVSFVESIIRLKSETRDQNGPVVRIVGELNKPEDKLIVKVDGKRTESQLVVDLVTKTAQFNLSTEDKRHLQHQTRIVKLNDKFYQVESMTTYKQKPIFKFNGKIAAILMENPEVVFSQQIRSFGPERISTFEATIFEPKPYQIKAEFDCVEKIAKIQCVNVYEKKVQMSLLKWEPQTETLIINGKLEEQNSSKPVYTFTSKINFPGLYEPHHCSSQTCQSEFIFKNEQAREQYMAKIVPGEYITFVTPKGHQDFTWVY